MSKKFLITRPRHDSAVEYLSTWSALVLNEAKKEKFETIDLEKSRANYKNFWKEVDRCQFVMINGHGSKASVTGDGNQVLISTRGKYKELKGKIIYARSCQTAKALGVWLVEMGVKAYIGYDDDYIIATSEEGVNDLLEDKTAKMFLEPSNLIGILILRGKKVKTAQEKSLKMMRKNFNYLLKSKIRYDREIAAYLWHDIKHQKLIEKQNLR